MPSPRHHSRSTIRTDVATAAAVTAALRAHGAAIAPSVPIAAAELVNSALHVLAEEARYTSGADGAAIALEDGNEMLCRAAAGTLSPGLGWRLDAESGFSGECVRTAQVLRCDDAENDSRVDAAVCRELGIRSMLAAPIVSGSRVRGIFELFSERPLAFTAEHQTRLAALAAEAAVVAYGASMSRPWPAVAAPALATVPTLASAPVAEPAVVPAAPEAEQIAPAPIAAAPETSQPLETFNWQMRVLGFESEKSEWSAFAWLAGKKKQLGAAVGALLMIALLALLVRTVTRPAASNPVVTDAEAGSTATTPSEDAASDNSAPVSSGDEAASRRSSTSPNSVLRPEARSRNSSASPAAKARVRSGASDAVPQRSEAPSGVPSRPKEALAPPSAAALAQVSHGTPSTIAELTNAPIAAPEIPPVRVTQGASAPVLLREVKPVYPITARNMGVQGAVVLEATVSEDGHVRNVRVVSGNSLLQAAAKTAVSGWRYRPSVLNGAPHAVQTRITVNFVLPR